VVGTCNTHVYIGEGLPCLGYAYDSHECLLVTFLGIIQFKLVHKHVRGLVWLWWSDLSFFLLLFFFSLLSLIFTSNTLLNSKVVRHLFFFYIKHGPQSFDLVFFSISSFNIRLPRNWVTYFLLVCFLLGYLGIMNWVAGLAS
jgi:hypothetical protein